MKRRKDNLIKAPLIMALILSALALVPPRASHAQVTDDAQRVREELARTDEVISMAQEAIRETKSEKARIVLNAAFEVQNRAWNSYRANGYRMAMRLTLEAREQAQRALSIARSETRSEENLLRILEETRNRLAMVRDMMIEKDIRDAQTKRLIDEAQRMIDKSRFNSQQNLYKLALSLASNAQKLAERAQERARNSIALKEAAERRISILERLMERTQEKLRATENERIRNELNNTRRGIDQAKELVFAGRYREANKICERCENSLRAMAHAAPIEREQQAKSVLAEVHALLERARETLQSEPMQDPEIAEAVEQARNMLENAENALQSGRENESIALANRAREILRRAFDSNVERFGRDRIEARIENLERIREQALNLARNCDATGVPALLERANLHLELARNHARNSNFESAAAETSIARNIYRRVMDICAR